MGIHKEDKLNSLQRLLPEGLIVDAAWLERHGYSRALRKKYVTRGWLDQVVRGVYRRPAPRLQERLRWQAVVISLQTLLGRPYTVGGRTALELQGFAHYLSGSHREIHLYGTGKPPGWLSKLHFEDQFVLHNADRLFKSNSRHPLRGCVYEPEVRSVSARVKEEFGFAEMSVVSFPDLYGGKIVAALDRQHPRDLFDVRDLIAKEGIDDKTRKAFALGGRNRLRR
jgi:hypothetical protein